MIAASIIGHATATRTMVDINNITMAFGQFVAIQNVSLCVKDGEFLSIVGPTGCGKSTILNAIAGLLKTTKGVVTIDNHEVTGIQNQIGYLFQQDALLPWKTALENTELGLLFRKIKKDERQLQTLEWLTKVGLKGYEHRYPHELSGGQRKRVQMAQVLITDPKVILMDEPFSALDIYPSTDAK